MHIVEFCLHCAERFNIDYSGKAENAEVAPDIGQLNTSDLWM